MKTIDMVHLPKYNLENHIYFITSEVKDRIHLFTREDYFKILIDNLEFYRRKFCFKLIGYVLMVNHLHLLIFPDINKGTCSEIMRDFNKFTAREIIKKLKKKDLKLVKEFLLRKQRRKNHRYQIWQSKTYDFNIFSKKKLKEKLNYIHMNPVRAGLTKNPQDYRWSSARNYYLGNNKGEIEIDFMLMWKNIIYNSLFLGTPGLVRGLALPSSRSNR